MANPFKRFVNWLGDTAKGVLSFSPVGLFMGDSGSKYSLPNQLGNSLGLDSALAKFTGTSLTGAEQQANAFNAQEAEKQRAWEEQMSNTSYQRGVADMQAAGLNPALMYGGSSQGASTPSGTSASSVSPGSGANIADLIATMVSLPAQIQLLKSQSKQASAQANKTEAEIPWVDRLNQADVESKQALAELNKERINEIKALVKEKEAACKKMAAEAKTEETKQLYNLSAAMLNNAQAAQIQALVPYQQLLMSAQADNQRADAALKLVQKAYQEKLFTDDYIDALIDSACAESGIKMNDKEKSDARNNILGFGADAGRKGVDRLLNRIGATLTYIIPGAKSVYD